MDIVYVHSLIKRKASGLLKGVTSGLTTGLETKFGYSYSIETTDDLRYFLPRLFRNPVGLALLFKIMKTVVSEPPASLAISFAVIFEMLFMLRK